MLKSQLNDYFPSKLHKYFIIIIFISKGFPRPPVCLEALGMQNGRIPDSAITASSEYNAASKAINGRLHFLMRSGRYGAWIAKRNDIFQYLQINFGDWTKVSRIAIQGRQDAEQWVKSFSISYSYDAVFFKDYNENGAKKVIGRQDNGNHHKKKDK